MKDLISNWGALVLGRTLSPHIMWKPNMGALSQRLPTNMQPTNMQPPHPTPPAISQTRNIDKEKDLTSLELLYLGPDPPPLQSPKTYAFQNPLLNPIGISTSILNAKSPSDSSKKKTKKEIEKYGRNIK